MSTGPAEGNSGADNAIDPALFWREDVRQVLAALDIGALYRVLGADAGISQRQIAARIGQSQSEVSEIVGGGRRVDSHRLLRRIATGFTIPPQLMGLSWWGPDGTYCGEDADAEAPDRESDDMRRRALIATTSMAALGQVLQGGGEPAELALPAGSPLPSRLEMVHVQTGQAVTVRLRDMARQFGGQAGLYAAAVQHYTRWLDVPGSDLVKAKLAAALAELYTEAAWASYDEGMAGTGYFTRGLRLADEAGDGVEIANAAWTAGATLVRSGHPNDALKCFQLGKCVLGGFQPGRSVPVTVRTDHPRLSTLTAWLNLSSATAYALNGAVDQAKRCLVEARDGWAPRDAFERAAMDRASAAVHLDLRRLDIAEPFAVSALRTYGEGHRRGRTQAELLLAEVHVRAGEPRGLVLAQQAIEAVRLLQSVAVRQERLVPLIAALEARPGSDAKDLVRTGRQVAATRA